MAPLPLKRHGIILTSFFFFWFFFLPPNAFAFALASALALAFALFFPGAIDMMAPRGRKAKRRCSTPGRVLANPGVQGWPRVRTKQPIKARRQAAFTFCFMASVEVGSLLYLLLANFFFLGLPAGAPKRSFST